MIAKGLFDMSVVLSSSPYLRILSAIACMRHHLGTRMLAEQMGEAALRLQVFLHRNLPTHLQHTGDFAMLGLEHGNMPLSLARRAMRIVSYDAVPQPSGQGTNSWM